MFCWFLFTLAALSWYSAVSAAPHRLSYGTPEYYKSRAFEKFDPIFNNFTNYLQDRNPSISVPVKEITTCIEENNATEALENFLIDAFVQLKLESDVNDRSELCRKNMITLSRCMGCIVNAEKTPFIDTLIKSAHFIIIQYCHSPSLERFKSLKSGPDMKIFPEEFDKPIQRFRELLATGKKPTEKDFCLPIRVAESYEVAVIQSRMFQFELHGFFGYVVHLVISIVGNYPFKSYEDCA